MKNSKQWKSTSNTKPFLSFPPYAQSLFCQSGGRTMLPVFRMWHNGEIPVCCAFCIQRITESSTSHWDVQGGSQRRGRLGNSLTVSFFLLGRISKSKFLRKMQVFFIIYFKTGSCRICKKISLWKRDELVHYIEGTNCWNELSVPLYVDIIHFFSESECNMSLIWNHWQLAKKTAENEEIFSVMERCLHFLKLTKFHCTLGPSESFCLNQELGKKHVHPIY